eukprot:9805686-Lingulodinium_polyedra.AAC.1
MGGSIVASGVAVVRNVDTHPDSLAASTPASVKLTLRSPSTFATAIVTTQPSSTSSRCNGRGAERAKT